MNRATLMSEAERIALLVGVDHPGVECTCHAPTLAMSTMNKVVIHPDLLTAPRHEVYAVLAHEFAHLKYQHCLKRILFFVGALITVIATVPTFGVGPALVMVAVCIGIYRGMVILQEVSADELAGMAIGDVSGLLSYLSRGKSFSSKMRRNAIRRLNIIAR